MKTAVFGVFSDIALVKAAIPRLKALLFRPIVISKDSEFERDVTALLSENEPSQVAAALSDLEAGKILIVVRSVIGLGAAEAVLRECGGKLREN